MMDVDLVLDSTIRCWTSNWNSLASNNWVQFHVIVFNKWTKSITDFFHKLLRIDLKWYNQLFLDDFDGIIRLNRMTGNLLTTAWWISSKMFNGYLDQTKIQNWFKQLETDEEIDDEIPQLEESSRRIDWYPSKWLSDSWYVDLPWNKGVRWCLMQLLIHPPSNQGMEIRTKNPSDEEPFSSQPRSQLVTRCRSFVLRIYSCSSIRSCIGAR